MFDTEGRQRQICISKRSPGLQRTNQRRTSGCWKAGCSRLAKRGSLAAMEAGRGAVDGFKRCFGGKDDWIWGRRRRRGPLMISVSGLCNYSHHSLGQKTPEEARLRGRLGVQFGTH